MEDTITISTQQDSTPDAWRYEFESTYNVDDTIFVCAPSGFNFRLVGKQEVVALLRYVLRGEQVLCPDGSRIYVDWTVPDGLVFCIDTDVWINPNFGYRAIICEARDFCELLIHILPLLP